MFKKNSNLTRVDLSILGDISHSQYGKSNNKNNVNGYYCVNGGKIVIKQIIQPVEEYVENIVEPHVVPV